jgi:hypothetical protein
MLVALVALLASGYAGPSAVVKALSESGSRFLPPFWYLGLYQSWQHRETPVLAQAARMALPGLAAAVLLMVICYALSYRRCFAAVLESRRQPSAQRLLRRLLDLFSARAGFPRACFQFVVRTMLRNEAHRLCLVMSIGVGWLMAFAARGLETPLAAAYIAILGARLAFELPAVLSANWIFRVALNAHTVESCPTNRVILSFLSPFVLAPTFVLSWLHSSWGAAFLETACVFALSLGLIAIFLEGYRKIPLTYPMPEFRDNFLLICLIHILGFELFIHLGARLERAILEKPFLFPLVPMAIYGGWFFNRTRWREPGLTFENLRAPVVERLNLSD